MTGWTYREVSDIDKELEEERSRAFFGTVVRDEEPNNLETVYRAEASTRAHSAPSSSKTHAQPYTETRIRGIRR